MKSTFLKRAWRPGRWFVAGFVALFLFRLAYGYVTPSSVNATAHASFFDGLVNVRKNYASEKVAMEALHQPDGNAMPSSSQKYEKTAELMSRSVQFEKDDRSLRAKTATFQGVIQYENADGLEGERELHLLIGISPEKFDSFYAEIRQIGDMRSMSVVKADKTNEFRQLNAQRASLEKTLASLQELKSKGGEVGDFVSLHDKILEIESRLQDLGVQLGDFSSENEYCTVKFSLYEGRPKQGITFFHRVKTALEWTLPVYLGFLGIGVLILVCSFMLLLVIDKLKIMQLVNRGDN